MKETKSAMLVFFIFFSMIVTACFIDGVVIGGASGEKNCKLPKYQSYIGIVVVPFYYSFWLGCELSERRFNLEDK